MWDRCVRQGLALAVILAVCCAFPGASGMASAGPSTHLSSATFERIQDDELPDAFDPDDDDDGTTDSSDPDPLDPTVVAEPTPGTIDSGADSDDDDLPNIQDPDDDQDGIVDEEDPAPFVPAPETPTVPAPAPAEEPAPAGGTTPNPGTDSNTGAPEVVQAPVALALPSTGVGQTASQSRVVAEGVLLITATLVMGMGTARLAWQKR